MLHFTLDTPHFGIFLNIFLDVFAFDLLHIVIITDDVIDYVQSDT